MESRNAPQTFVQLPPTALTALLRLRSTGQTRRVRRAGKQPPAERVDHARDECIVSTYVLRAPRLRLLLLLLQWQLLPLPCPCPCCCCGCPACCADDDPPCATRDPSLLEPAAISVPSESSPESSACGSALPDAHADAESPERPDSCRSCDAENALLPWLLSCPAAQNPLPLRTLCASSTPLRTWL